MDSQQKKEVVSLNFRGNASYEVIDALLDDLYDQLEQFEKNTSVRKKVYSVLVEILQNICNYAHSGLMSDYEGQQDEKMAVLKLASTETHYEIETGNFISNDYIKILKSWLDTVNTLHKDAIRNLYKEFIKNGKFSPESGGAGLGFLEIAQKSDEKWIYSFEPVDDEISFFNFKVHIDKKDQKK